MILKKTNAVLGILSSIAVVVHMVYNCFSYLTFYYNPTLKLATSLPLLCNNDFFRIEQIHGTMHLIRTLYYRRS